jgi:hypothetical protein
MQLYVKYWHVLHLGDGHTQIINDKGVSTLNQACSGWYSGTLKLILVAKCLNTHMQDQSAIFVLIVLGINGEYVRYLNWVFSIINRVCTHSFSHEYNTLYTIRAHRSVPFMWGSLRLAPIMMIPNRYRTVNSWHMYDVCNLYFSLINILHNCHCIHHFGFLDLITALMFTVFPAFEISRVTTASSSRGKWLKCKIS